MGFVNAKQEVLAYAKTYGATIPNYFESVICILNEQYREDSQGDDRTPDFRQETLHHDPYAEHYQLPYAEHYQLDARSYDQINMRNQES